MSILLYPFLRIAVILKSWVITFWYRTHLTLTLKMMLWKCCTQYASKFGKLSNGHRTGKGQNSFQSQRKALPKKVQITAQLHSSHTLVKGMLKIIQARLQQYVNNFQMFKLDLEKAEEPEINCQPLLDHGKSKRVPRKHLLLHWLS